MNRPLLTLILSALLAGVTAMGTGRAQGNGDMAGMQMQPAPATNTNAGNTRVSAAVRAVRVEQGWVSAAPPGAEELSAYLVLSNPGKVALTLTGVATPIAGQATLMQTGKDAAGRGTMQMVTGMKVPAGGRLKILPGRAHLMFRALRHQPQPGEQVAITLRFSDGSALLLKLPVRRLP